LFDPFGKDSQFSLGLRGLKGSLNYGFLHHMAKATGKSKGVLLGYDHCHTTFMVNTDAGKGSVAGTEVKFNHGTGKFDMRLALKMQQHDHLLGL